MPLGYVRIRSVFFPNSDSELKGSTSGSKKGTEESTVALGGAVPEVSLDAVSAASRAAAVPPCRENPLKVPEIFCLDPVFDRMNRNAEA